MLMMRRWISIFIKTTSNKNSEKKLDAKKKKLQNPNPAKVMRCNSGRLGAYSRIHQQQQQQWLNGIIHFILNFYFPIRFLFAPIIKLNRICNRKKQKKKLIMSTCVSHDNTTATTAATYLTDSYLMMANLWNRLVR